MIVLPGLHLVLMSIEMIGLGNYGDFGNLSFASVNVHNENKIGDFGNVGDI